MFSVILVQLYIEVCFRGRFDSSSL